MDVSPLELYLDSGVELSPIECGFDEDAQIDAVERAGAMVEEDKNVEEEVGEVDTMAYRTWRNQWRCDFCGAECLCWTVRPDLC